MGRKKFIRKREILPDPKFNDVVIAKFINSLMERGKRSLAESILYGCVDNIQERTGEDGLKIFKKGLENVKPLLEVKSRRVGGATYQVPIEVKPARRQSLASRWLIDSARGRPEHSMAERLAAELIEAANGRGGAMKKREDVHKMADANKAFAHYRW
ncbi:MAG TPA: 30S ribosomal protein S7 [Bdellovibrionales bacterium]|nr:MAG: 30S ribosomal protein S7 [Bdellovibrionales bacterium GWB1_52_6]OFZ02596.1 MAG: 30S ribosomal protein S7 [Bdellovibrionales bacterium GWA1_52_35]OFZ40509.1 MAG: 30S ribosomal protein S7 [Bdellovibrionales bacterium GWC1_52_8]HAR41288.1 30S ribosomal protein S7 [Bdellovibrionales bacterium]HCM41449.1 30S ribosomal protein S7 [Bdellovibrionales bacterium]